MSLMKRVFFMQIKDFLYKHNLGTDLKIFPGYFISPSSVQNLQEQKKKQAIMLDISMIELYRKKYGRQIECLEYFLQLNKININLNDSDAFNTYLALLSYMVALYKGDFQYPLHNDAKDKWESVHKHLIPGNVLGMYKSLKEHLSKKGLTDTSINSIIFNNRVERHDGLENSLVMLNSLAEISRSAIKKNGNYLIRDIGLFRKTDPMGIHIAETMDRIVRDKKTQIQKWLMSRFHSEDSLLLNLDSDPSMHDKFNGKLPDLFFIDDKLNVCGLDTIVHLCHADPKELSSQALSHALLHINLLGEINKV